MKKKTTKKKITEKKEKKKSKKTAKKRVNRNTKKEEKLNIVRDIIGFLLFMAIIGAIFYGIHEKSGGTVYVCLTIISIVILIFWLNPAVKELYLKYHKGKGGSVKVKQNNKK